jgi:transposase
VDADRPGRPRRLDEHQIDQIQEAFHLSPADYGFTANLWDGKLLSHFISQQFGIAIGIRQCQRLFRQLKFRLRKPRPLTAKTERL